MIDGYQLFMEKFNIDEKQMIEFGIDETIVIPDNLVRREWEILKKNIYSGKEKNSSEDMGETLKERIYT